mmetsp:Transcript_29872/g.63967  ORF Transcript_29872/g.63967 Transcript_29872/m.63967 type:complete len:280 (+) Transcript_29872:126-965(+)|eukprot:CAMPEP_0201133182 /NCGR_PEP_ID=MMETSP0850-20130426/48111_1 /ASSEMBLY_ACC=CAM_ASM_000622 /TAXON_ID=183588 /ORGANISM="Pseudo-nitzschia fraudulenta, Strain WWA7" /LENGTH=279 /DNA_ID=CAMNT_0047403751 /DNA_START=111 /DNA_END=950 /DNA_ORIENTATION=-
MAATDNDFKLSYAFKTLSAYAFLAFLGGRCTTNCSLSLGILITYQLWNVIWIKLLWSTEHIYSVKVPTTILSDWIQFSVPSGQELKIRKDRVVTSISELSGIRGGHLMIALRIVTSVISALVVVVIQIDLQYRKTTFLNIQSGKDFVPIGLFFLIVGFFCTGHFELNMQDSFHTSGHFFGVCMIFLGSLSCGFVFDWNLLSIVLIALHFGLAVYWVRLTKSVPKKSDDIKEVTRISKWCIGVELLMFQVTNIILVSTVYSSGQNEGNLFASPVFTYDEN